MPRSVRACLLAVVASVVAACGGGGDDPEVRAARRLQIQAAMMADAARRETPAYACLRTASTKLMVAGATPADLSVDCLAGVYHGKTPKGDSCVFQVGANAGRFHFRLEGATLRIGPEIELGAPADGARHHSIERADVETDQIGIRLLRGSGTTANVVETVVVAGGRRESGTADITSVAYERVAGQHVKIARCFFGG